MNAFMNDAEVADRIFTHIDNKTTDLADGCWREPVANYISQARYDAELTQVLRRTPTPFCPSAALPEIGAYVARDAAGTPLLAVRGNDSLVRVFRNACRHRGAQLVPGNDERQESRSGCTKVLTCPYHGWAYGLDGALRLIPHAHGFPDVDKHTHGLVPVHSIEHGGLVFVQQDGEFDPREVEALPELLPPSLELLTNRENDVVGNWKVSAEGFIEGYHILPTHRETFYPVQFDNLNVVEYVGRNSRVTYPYRNVQKLRALPPHERRLRGTVTHVYHLFPNVFLATFPKRTQLIVLEPQGLGRTRNINYSLADASEIASSTDAIARDADFANLGAAEDRAVVASIQRSIGSGANEVFEFGRFEGAIGHFHRNLNAALDAA